MNFRRAETDINFPLLRMVSEGGRWEVGYYPVIFGARVRLGQVGECFVELDYCAGDDPNLLLEILVLILRILAPMAEDDVTATFIKGTFPGWSRRPIDRDPTCLHKLRELASAAEAD